MENIFIPDGIIKGTFSCPKLKDYKYEKAKIELIIIGDKSKYQISYYTKTQVFHKNIEIESIDFLNIDTLDNEFNNLELFTSDYIYGYRISSKGKLLTNKRKNETSFVSVDHNRKKNYIIPEDTIVEPLIDLGVLTKDGKIVKASYDKYRQINRFLEMIDDSIKNEKYLKIIDFGCGKSYLTFILYYYLIYIRKIECDIIGLDLKEDVIDNCNKLAKKYNYDRLKFLKGDVAKYKDDSVDMIITLHACDTATDYALYHAINMKCRYIFSVPCCQHEINGKLEPNVLRVVNKYGILKERFSAILTDAIRANILEYYGYKTQVMEFVDIENSPKNLLIRATLSGKKNEKIKEEIESLLNEYRITQKLYELCFK